MNEKLPRSWTKGPESGAAPVVAALEYLTGPARGEITWLGAAGIDIAPAAGRHIAFADSDPDRPGANLIARLRRVGETYEAEATSDITVWVNRAPITTRLLAHGDMIEFGDTGPLCRYRLYRPGSHGRKTIPDILGDSVDYLRSSRQPVGNRIYRALCGLLWRLTRETTVLFRVTVLFALAAFGLLAYQQHRLNLRLEQIIESGAARLDSVAAALARSRDEALRPADLAALRAEVQEGVSANAERLAALEQRSVAIGRTIAEATPSVAFLQGSYGFREQSTGRMLRHSVTPDGVPLISPRGQPLLTLDGEGPVAELTFTGTAFFVGETGALATNRHVALPWESDTAPGELISGDLEPVMIRFIAYLPGNTQGFPVTLLQVSDSADLALLSLTDVDEVPPGLKLADAPPAAGDEVVVMGYPTGLRSMLAQTGPAFIDELQKGEKIGFWEVAERLAEAGYISPLASRGIIGHTTGETVVYDAETTHGGSGGPVLDLAGRVVAVNSAILPEYGGSNLGLPAAKVRELMESAGIL